MSPEYKLPKSLSILFSSANFFFPQPYFFGEGIEVYWFTFCALDRHLEFTDLIYGYQDGIIKKKSDSAIALQIQLKHVLCAYLTLGAKDKS